MTELTHAPMHPALPPVKRPARTTLHRTAGLALAVGLSVGFLSGVGSATPASAAEPTPAVVETTAKEAQLGYQLNAGPRLRTKYHHTTRFFGPIYNGKILGDCVDYGKANPDGDWSTGAFGHVTGTTLRKQIHFVESKWWAPGLTSKTISAARNSTVNRLKDADFRYDWTHSYTAQFRSIDKAVPALSDRMIDEAMKYAGPVKATSAFTTTPQKKGDRGSVRVTVKANGRIYPGQAITWTLTGGRIATAGKTTRKDGTAILSLIQTSAAPVTATAAVTTPDWSKAKFSTPTSKKKQHLVRGVGPVTTRTTISHYGVTITQDCAGECEGKPPVTFTAKAGANPVEWKVTAGKTTVATLALKANATGKKTFTGKDGQTLTFRYRVKVGKTWSGWRTSRTFNVICPAWPIVKVTKTCACKGDQTVTYTLTSPGGPRGYEGRLTINGVPQAATFSGTESATLAGPVKAGDRVALTWVAYAAPGSSKQLATGVFDDWTRN